MSSRTLTHAHSHTHTLRYVGSFVPVGSSRWTRFWCTINSNQHLIASIPRSFALCDFHSGPGSARRFCVQHAHRCAATGAEQRAPCGPPFTLTYTHTHGRTHLGAFMDLVSETERCARCAAYVYTLGMCERMLAHVDIPVSNLIRITSCLGSLLYEFVPGPPSPPIPLAALASERGNM